MATKKEIDLADFDLPKMTMDMYLQSERLKTFKDWPFHDNCNCTAEMMAEAGFYHTPSSNEPDLVTCYVCYKEMDGWEPTDDPWVEHKNHSSKCPFVAIGKKQSDWTVEDTIKMEIKRQEYGITKVVESVIAKMENDAQAVIDELEELMES
ncbi:baculoviral IAP repeat-containing protein 5-like [Rhopilema esculentum]|uniref:baculoviral IAP repeat-containing protein 5-like n=1 Tax=Rhopilema esculentum TaxID=499914 RepID=UPI0031D2E528|eukprot:gene9309-17008_t